MWTEARWHLPFLALGLASTFLALWGLLEVWPSGVQEMGACTRPLALVLLLLLTALNIWYTLALLLQRRGDGEAA